MEELGFKSIEESLETLLRGDDGDLDAYLLGIGSQVDIADTKAKVHCYVVTHDGNDRPRVKDLARAVAARVLDYAIPRSELQKAHEQMVSNKSTAKFVELVVKAKKLFSDAPKSGEGGEMLLYMLAQAKLRLPQVLCKMSLKTNSRLHYNGADALHMSYDKTEDKLALYWGEAKLYGSVSEAIRECLDSIGPFLCDDGGTDARQSRDLELLSGYLDLGDSELEEALIRYLDPDDPMFNKLQYRGVCLVGFNESAYPGETESKKHQEVISSVEAAFSNWQLQIGRNLRSRSPLHDFHMEIFLVPFPSVSKYREYFLGEINHG